MFPNGNFVDHIKPVDAINASADIFNGDPTTDWVQLKDYRKVVFIAKISGGTTGKGTFTVEQADNAAGDNPVAMAFTYSKVTSGALGAKTAATAAGVQTTATESALYIIEVNAEDLTAGKAFVSVTATEDTDDPVAGCIIALACGPRLGTDVSAVA